MRPVHLNLLRCPHCRGGLEIEVEEASADGRVESGALLCDPCSRRYPIVRFIPRFVPIENYASGFGLEWMKHARTQYDSHSGVPLSEKRFFEETGWSRNLRGEVVLEAGSGSGRFTEQAARTEAMVVSVDYSYAVEANYRSNGNRRNVLIVQGDILQLPLAPESFDKTFCFGVLQHTPDPHASFQSLVGCVKPDGELVVDVYKKTFAKYVLGTKYWVRSLTRWVSPERLYRWVRNYVDFMWPVASVVRKIPKIGVPLNWRLLVADYTNEGVRGEMLREWAYLDTFDMLAPRYDSPRTRKDLQTWFEEARFADVDVRYGYNGVQGRGRRPALIHAQGREPKRVAH